MNFLCSVERDEETSNCWRYIDSWIFLISREKMLGPETDTDMLTKQMYVLTKYLDTVVKSAPFIFSALIILFRHWIEQKQVDGRVMFKNYTDSLGSFSKMVICMNNFMLYSTWIDCILYSITTRKLQNMHMTNYIPHSFGCSIFIFQMSPHLSISFCFCNIVVLKNTPFTSSFHWKNQIFLQKQSGAR